jgi:hypothetical protein
MTGFCDVLARISGVSAVRACPHSADVEDIEVEFDDNARTRSALVMVFTVAVELSDEDIVLLVTRLAERRFLRGQKGQIRFQDDAGRTRDIG